MESNWFKEMFIDEAKSAANSRNGVTDDQIENAVTEYLYENPVEHPTQVSAFENDAGYLTEHQDLSGYAAIDDIPTDDHINDLIEDYMEANPVEASGGVKSVNGVEPDEKGNVEIEIPGSSQGACLPVVELSTPIAPDVTLTEEESAALTAAAQNKQCPIMKFQFLGIDFVVVATFVNQFSEYGFIVQVSQFGFQFTHADSDSPWSVIVTGLE